MNQALDHLDKLKIFVVVADNGKINESAKTLGLTQPSVSRAIRTLEDAFEAKLFVRGRYGVRLTSAGQILHHSASRMLREVSDLSVRMKQSGDLLAGSLVVGSYESLAEYLWPGFLVQLRESHPHLHLSVRTGGGKDSFTRLTEGLVDLLVDAEPRTSEETTSWALYSDRFGFYGSKQTRISRLTQEDTRSESLLYVPHAYDGNGLAIEDHLRRAGYSFEREHLFDSFSTIKRMAIHGLGIAVLPNRLAQEDLKENRLSKISLKGFSDEGFGKHTIYATCAAQRDSDLRIRKLMSMLKSYFQELSSSSKS